jgi:5-methylcytosine-specific restriction endonuclease McrA
MPKLSIELVPKTAWGKNVRSEVSAKAWDTIRHKVYAEFSAKCAVCRHKDRVLHCHEVWGYDDVKRVQRLVYMVALCEKCHSVKHMGRTMAMGHGAAATRHLARQNKWTMEHAKRYIEEQFAKNAERSQHKWTLDLSGLSRYLTEETPANRKQA